MKTLDALKELIERHERLDLLTEGIGRLERHIKADCYLSWQDGDLWLFRKDGDGILGAIGLEDLIEELGLRGDLDATLG